MGLLKGIMDLFSAKEEPMRYKTLGRNDLCWCGSGKKYKKCHLEGDEKKYREKYSGLMCGKT